MKIPLLKVPATCQGVLVALALGSLQPNSASAQADNEALVFMTGAEPIAAADYEALPKVGQFRAFLPKQVDLAPLFPKPGYQGAQPNCVAWATTYAAYSFLLADGAADKSAKSDPMSPAYVYNRLRKPGSACDRAIRIVDALKLLQSEGSVALSDFPDDIARCAIPAPPTIIDKAKAARLSDWRAISRSRRADGSKVVLDDIKGAASRGEPVVFAMPVMADFKALKGDTVYRHEQPENTNWHAMAVVGYDEARQAFRVINSWGTHWGDAGYAWIDYTTFGLLVGEAYAMKMLPQALPKAAPNIVPVDKASLPQVVDAYTTFESKAAALTCGKVTAVRNGEQLTVNGFGGDEAEVAALRKDAFALNKRVAWDVRVRHWPQCEAELTLSDALSLEGVKVALASPDRKALTGDPIAMKSGDIFGIRANASAERPWLSVIYLQADGSAVKLFRGNVGSKPVTIGLGGAEETRFQVGAPFGDEMIIALSSSGPLFEATKSDYSTEREFLSGLRSALSKREKGSASAAVLRLRTYD
ncbi:C1 family peptidase [Novosphingobium hassiacum]|uniref:C1 family peptidase n=1 Tax=Novosphingobium hassiacum TaxID=173676 RepID=UPI0031B5DF08